MRLTRKEQCAMALELLQQHPDGLGRFGIAERLGISERAAFKVLTALQQADKVGWLRVGQKHSLWTAAEHIDELREKKCAGLLKEAELPKRRQPLRAWTRHEEAWTPPGPRIPSVWHLAEVMA